MTDEAEFVRVARTIAARPEAIFEVLADPARHGELAGSDQVLGAAPGSPDRLSLEARFGMRMRQIGPAYTSVNEVVEFEENHRIAWQTWGMIRGRKRIGGQLWRFTLMPEDGHTCVVHEYEWGRSLTPRALRLLRYPQRSRRHMRATLERLDRLLHP